VVDLTASTQSDLLSLANSKKLEAGEVIVAEYQSAGRGRLDRTFEAASGTALLFSFYVSPKREKNEWGFITQLAALTMHENIAPDLPVECSVKWPNDILIGEKKVAGLLAQATEGGVIVGIGLNVEMGIEELPVTTATSLKISGSNNLNRNILLSNFLNAFEIIFRKWDAGEDFIDRYAAVCSTLGRPVNIEVAGRESRSGVADSINKFGALVLTDGFEVTIGDVVHLR